MAVVRGATRAGVALGPSHLHSSAAWEPSLAAPDPEPSRSAWLQGSRQPHRAPLRPSVTVLVNFPFENPM